MFLKIFVLSLFFLLVLDSLWLGIIAKDFYSSKIGFLFKKNLDWTAIVIFYILFSLGISFFVIQPSLDKGSLINVLLLGAFFGAIAYSTYDLTNQAIIKDWPVLVTIVDIAWGIFVSSSISVLVYLIIQKI